MQVKREKNQRIKRKKVQSEEGKSYKNGKIDKKSEKDKNQEPKGYKKEGKDKTEGFLKKKNSEIE